MVYAAAPAFTERSTLVGQAWRFVVLTSPDLQNMLRVLNPFAVQGLTPSAVTAEFQDGNCRIEIKLADVNERLAHRVLALLNNQPTTRGAQLTSC